MLFLSIMSAILFMYQELSTSMTVAIVYFSGIFQLMDQQLCQKYLEFIGIISWMPILFMLSSDVNPLLEERSQDHYIEIQSDFTNSYSSKCSKRPCWTQEFFSKKFESVKSSFAESELESRGRRSTSKRLWADSIHYYFDEDSESEEQTHTDNSNYNKPFMSHDRIKMESSISEEEEHHLEMKLLKSAQGSFMENSVHKKSKVSNSDQNNNPQALRCLK